MKKFFLILIIFALIQSVWGLTTYKAKSLKLDGDADGTFQEFTETDISQRVNVTNYDTGATSDVAVFSGTGTSWVSRGLADVGLNPANVVTVAESGADYTTIQEAIDSISDAASTNTYTVFVYPGTYDEKITCKDYVSLVGIDRKSCRIVSDQTWDEVNAQTGYVVRITNGELRNFYIENERSSYPSVAVYMSGEGLVKNCDLISHAQDVLIVDNGCVSNCYINTDSISSTTDAISVRGGTSEMFDCLIEVSGGCGLWMGSGNSTTKIYNSTFITGSSYPGMRSQDSGLTINLYLYGCEFYNDNGAAPLFQNSDGSNTTVYYSQCVGSGVGNSNVTFTERKTLSLDVAGDVTIGDELTVINDVEIGDVATIDELFLKWTSGTSGKLEFGWQEDVPGSPTYDTNLYRGASNVLKTDDIFIADSLRTGTANNPATGGINASGDINTSGTVLADTAYKIGDTTICDSNQYGYFAKLGIVETDMDYPLHVDGRVVFDMQGGSQYMYIRDSAEGNLSIIGNDSDGDGELLIYDSSHTAKVYFRTDGNVGYCKNDFEFGDGGETLTVKDRLILNPVTSAATSNGAMYYDVDVHHGYICCNGSYVQIDNPCIDLFIEEIHEAGNGTTITLRQIGSLWDKAKTKSEVVSIPFRVKLGSLALRIMATQPGETAVVDKYQLYYKRDGKIEKLQPVGIQGESPCPFGVFIRLEYDLPEGAECLNFAAKGRLENEFQAYAEVDLE